jgi:uncharacterized membrane protein
MNVWVILLVGLLLISNLAWAVVYWIERDISRIAKRGWVRWRAIAQDYARAAKVDEK